MRGKDILDLRSQELSGCAKRVAILPELAVILLESALVLLCSSQARAREHAENVSSDFDLSRVRTGRGVDERCERALSAEHRFGAHCSANLGEQCEVYGLIEREGSDGRRKGRAVEDSQMFLGRERNGCDIGLLEGDARRHDLARTERLVTREDTDGWIADKRASDVRQRREICER